MIPSRIKPYLMVFLLMFSFFLMINCASSKQINPQDVYLYPNTDFSKYKRLAIILDLNQLPEERREGMLFFLLKEELEKRGYNILSNAFSVKNLSDPKKLSNLKDSLDILAIVKITVDKYEFEETMRSAGKFFTQNYSKGGARDDMSTKEQV